MQTYQTPYRQSSRERTIAHIASSVPTATVFAFPLSPTTSASIPLSTMPNNIVCTARFNLWSLVRILAVRMSDKMVFRMKERSDDDVVRGRSGKRVFKSLHDEGSGKESLGHGGTNSIDVITPLFFSITRFCTRVFLVSGDSVP